MKNKIKAISIFSSMVYILPFIALAQTKTNTLSDLIRLIVYYLNLALGLMMGIAVVFFVYSVIKYFITPSEQSRAEGSKYLMWSLIGFFAILSFWGLVNILVQTFNFGQNSPGNWSGFFNLLPK